MGVLPLGVVLVRPPRMTLVIAILEADMCWVASKHSIQTGAGVIDADYRGPVMVLLFNHSDTDFEGTSLLF